LKRILILSELWYPQGGGAELATYLYVKKMMDAGIKVTLFTNCDANTKDLAEDATIKFPFRVSSLTKPGLLLNKHIIEKKVKKLSINHDIIYIPGKLIFLAPVLRKTNPSSRIIVHLHDYQLVCPHASLYNFTHFQRCRVIWNDSMCARCTFKYESIDKGGLVKPLFGFSETLAWKRVLDFSKTLYSVETFFTVSKRQTEIIAGILGKYSNDFLKKNITLYNPVDESINYIPPTFGKEVCLGFMGGDRYIKGFDLAKTIVQQLNEGSFKILITKSKNIRKDNNLEFLGFLSKKEIVNFFKQVWMVLFMSRWDEPLPYVIAEAQLRGRPVIARDVGGVEESIAKRGFTGDFIDESYESFESHIKEYSVLLEGRASEYTEEISSVSKDFFEARTVTSYDTFLKLLN